MSNATFYRNRRAIPNSNALGITATRLAGINFTIMKNIVLLSAFLLLCGILCVANPNLSDTLRCSGMIAVKSDGTIIEIIKDFAPWLVALFLGISTIILTNRQIKLSSKSMDKQIATSKEIAQLELNKSVKSANRQQWINTLRDCLSEYLASLETYKVKFENAKKNNEAVTFKKNENYAYEIRRIGIKIELMLNPEENKSENLLYTIFALSSLVVSDKVDFHSEEYLNQYGKLLQQLMDTAKSILKEEWERVKKGD